MPTPQDPTATPTRDEIVAHARQTHGAYIAGRIERTMPRFPTVTSFLAANKAALMKAYNEAHPQAKRGVGAGFFRTHGEIVAWVKSLRLDAAKARERADAEAAAKEEAERRDNPRFTLRQLQSVVSFMELCGVAEIDLKGAVEFFRVMKVELPAAVK